MRKTLSTRTGMRTRMKVKVDGKWYVLYPASRIVGVRKRWRKRRPLTAAQKLRSLEGRRLYRKIDSAYLASKKAQLQWARSIVAYADLVSDLRKARLR